MSRSSSPSRKLNKKRKQEMRRKLGEAQNWRCCYCGRRFEDEGFLRPTFEHVTPRKFGGETSAENMVLACSHCNYKRGDQGLENFFVEYMQPASPDNPSTKPA